ncbi:hypothetical protein PVK63_06360 [Aliivibrio sp. S2TY2]|uniref:hypothetical protein n=1 Tax=unclassified Aliivibrio TaxID=2645654 RepID=UPI0023783F75|nr:MULTISPECIES: hypothetical protein [unclassified Aliivibrio]MDD9174493.1 hypothetical protein [Aliivibrio sp. S3TY1]MDD9191571.1 hypothetical protein [Aliivibrio sp. S2TY2]
MSVEFSQADVDTAIKALERCRLTYQQEQVILRRIGRAVIKQAKLNIRKQRDIHGQAFAPRVKKRKGRRRLLPNIAKKLRGKTDANHVDVGFGNGLTGEIAHKQQYGTPSETWDGRRMTRVRGPVNSYKKPATARQAKILLNAGFKIKKLRGKGKKRPTVKWIKENLKQGQLWAIWKELTDKEAVRTWEIRNTPRAFLGLTREQSDQIITREVLRIKG